MADAGSTKETILAYVEARDAVAKGDVAETPRLRRLEAKIVAENVGLVKREATRLRPVVKTREEYEDRVQAGTIGFLRAMRMYDPLNSAKAKLSTFGLIHIRDQIQRHQREAGDRNARVPGDPNRQAEAYYAQHGRWPEPHEIGATAAQLDHTRKMYSTEGLNESGATRGLPGGSGAWDGKHSFEGGSDALSRLPAEGPDTEEQARENERGDIVRTAVRKLRNPERRVLMAYFWTCHEDVAEVARQLHMSESACHRALSSGLDQLKDLIRIPRR